MASRIASAGIALLALALASPAWGQLPLPPDAEKVIGQQYTGRTYSPYAKRDFPDRLYWGDTHLHSSFSFDAGAFGNRLGPNDAYRFAAGAELTASGGQAVRLSQPLDFLVLSDHSDNMGFFSDLLAGKPHIMSDAQGKDWHERIKAGDGPAVAVELIKHFSQGTFPKSLTYTPDSKPYSAAWQATLEAAEANNRPGVFTAFIGYEWTSLIKGGNMHRVVIYRDDADRAGKLVPYTTYPPQGSPNPRDLWKWMDGYEEQTGGRVLAIAHNGNLANGIMFPLEAQYDGTKLDEAYVETRIAREPLYEVTQIKGDGEAHPLLSPTDEFADYYNWDLGNLDLSELKTDDMLAGEYGREALKRGLALEAKLGTNPYKFGQIGSTDSHTALATAEENNFFGKHAGYEPNLERMTHPLLQGNGVGFMGWAQMAGGLAAVWARDNTREALFDAMERKEVYATTGPRMAVRLFGGWAYTDDDLNSREPAFAGYDKGVPMGSDLPARPGDAEAPTFMAIALRDPIGANLDRIQIVKGWLDADGETHEKVYDVALSDGRQASLLGGVPPVGNTVDVATASWTNTIGDSELGAVWTDPDFDPAQRAFYYARVIEIPTPTWTTYDAFRLGVEHPKEAPTSHQERAYTSPIWYTPGG